ncbi:hypothetical protein KM043_007804 [Ampulex compressa]|nr:hypothetical protein KM043_007804 [Ampulex compressa]
MFIYKLQTRNRELSVVPALNIRVGNKVQEYLSRGRQVDFWIATTMADSISLRRSCAPNKIPDGSPYKLAVSTGAPQICSLKPRPMGLVIIPHIPADIGKSGVSVMDRGLACTAMENLSAVQLPGMLKDDKRIGRSEELKATTFLCTRPFLLQTQIARTGYIEDLNIAKGQCSFGVYLSKN